MTDHQIGRETFAWARRAQRLDRAARLRLRREETRRGLWNARDAFVASVDQAYGSGSGAAARDADRLETMAERLVDFVASLEPAVGRLEVSTDRVLRRAGFQVRGEVDFDAPALTDALAETLAESLLGEGARSVLIAAARNASAR